MLSLCSFVPFEPSWFKKNIGDSESIPTSPRLCGKKININY